MNDSEERMEVNDEKKRQSEKVAEMTERHVITEWKTVRQIQKEEK